MLLTWLRGSHVDCQQGVSVGHVSQHVLPCLVPALVPRVRQVTTTLMKPHELADVRRVVSTMLAWNLKFDLAGTSAVGAADRRCCCYRLVGNGDNLQPKVAT